MNYTLHAVYAGSILTVSTAWERCEKKGRGGSLLMQVGRHKALGEGGGSVLSLISSKRVLKNVEGTFI